MSRFIIRRFFASLLSLVAVTMLVFFMSRVYGDPLVLLLPEEGYGLSQEKLNEYAERFHLNDPIPVQYAYWVRDLLTGDFGIDLADRRPLAPKLRRKIAPTLYLASAAWILATLVGTPLGILSAVRRGSIWDYLGRMFAVSGQSLPSFWIAIVGILIFSVWLGWLPVGTMGEGFAVRNFILPTAILAWLPMAGYLRLVRSAMLDTLDSEFIKLARAKGVSGRAVIWKHGLRNALIPPLTFGGLLLAGLISGSIAVETVFAWPGIARWGVEAVWNNNFGVLALVTLTFTIGYVVLSFIVDLLYSLVDPRVRYS